MSRSLRPGSLVLALALASCGNTDGGSASVVTGPSGGASGEMVVSSGGSTGSGGVTGGTGGAIAGGGAGGTPSGGGSGGAPSGGAGGAPSDGGLGGALTATDAGSGDAGSGPTGGPSQCPNGVIFCDGFEQDLDPAVWTKREKVGGTVAVDTTHAFRGQKALHVHMAGAGGPAYVSESKSFPVPNNVFYARMYYWFDDPIQRGDHFSLAEASGTGGDVARFGGQSRALGVGSDGPSSGDWTDNDGMAIPTKQWLCFEVLFKGATSEFQVWVDGVERTRLHSGSNRHRGYKMPQFNKFWVGWWDFNGAEPQDIWIDEIAIDSKPIGCIK